MDISAEANHARRTDPAARRVGIALAVLIGCCVILLSIAARSIFFPPQRANKPPRKTSNGKVARWWDAVPDSIRQSSVTTADSNIHRHDYAGPESCQACHEQNYADWSRHPHRWMNTLATDVTVKGDVSGTAAISYLGGEARFFQDGENYRMSLVRGDARREYRITQTIGSRFFQYYVGKQVTGPEPPGHREYTTDHVLPFGYWLDHHEWVPVVHLGEELPDGKRADPFQPLEEDFRTYAVLCNTCHTTFPLGDTLARMPMLMGRHSPARMHFAMADYLAQEHPELWDPRRDPFTASDPEVNAVIESLFEMEAPRHAVTLGVSCEACHLGAAKHAAGKRKRPQFFPHSPHLYVETGGQKIDYGRTRTNINWACGRCHAGGRPHYAAGMATWNSTEYTDAMRGSCYSQLTCVHCHNPHRGIGQKWPLTADQDDALCLKCHEKYEPTEERGRHTHHPAGSEGSRCMNCHMPRLNEGLQDIVRTHTIFSPTQARMIEANQPNACNQCHVRESIDWTLGHLEQWYGRTYSDELISARYRNRSQSAAVEWLHSENEAVRLVAADALTRAGARWALRDLLAALDDPFLINRQFARIGLEKMLNIRLDEFGYRFFQMPEEREEPLRKIRANVLLPPAQIPTEGSRPP